MNKFEGNKEIFCDDISFDKSGQSAYSKIRPEIIYSHKLMERNNFISMT